MKKYCKIINQWMERINLWNLWWIGIPLLLVVFSPFLVLKEGSIFVIHDQLDESMMNYVLTARHLGANQIPELLGGVNASGMQPSALLFIPLYCVLPAFWAFLLQYGICFLTAFVGMYFLLKEISSSSILAVAMAGCFAMLPVYPLYGLSSYGIPLVFYAFLCLWRRKGRMLPYVLIAYYALASHLVYTGYAVLTLTGMIVFVGLLRKKKCILFILGVVELGILYVLENYRLFWELFFGRGEYVSHRTEQVNASMPFWNTVRNVFLNSAQHADSLHQYLILPIVGMLLGALILRHAKKNSWILQQERCLRLALWGILYLVVTACFYGICKSEQVVSWKNSVEGFLHYFQAERFYWLYPAVWYLEFGLLAAIWWQTIRSNLGKWILLVALLLPTLNLIKEQSFFYMNVNQINNGSGITGYVSWESFYAEDLMQQLEEAIGRDPSTYRVAHLGISPAPSMMHGFYTVDGYSNNYSLEYKHQFRQVIAKELEQDPEIRSYFDTWGSRCYLFNRQTGTYWMLGKGSGITYQGLELDIEALSDLGCAYLFSGAEIEDCDQMGLTPLGYYETSTSYWGIWLYGLPSSF